MIRIKNKEDMLKVGTNFFHGHLPEMINSEILLNGENNVIYCQDKVTLKNVTLRFLGNNSVVFLSSSKHAYTLTTNIFSSSVLFFGEDNYFNPHGQSMSLTLSEGKNIFFGSRCLLSFGISIRLADPHLIFDAKTKRRINHSKSVFVGDHVWIGQDALLLKGTKIGSGSIIGASSVLSNKSVHSNSSWAGNPARLLRNDVFYTEECVHDWGPVETRAFENKDTDAYIFSFKDDETKSFDSIDNELFSLTNAKEKLGYIISNISSFNKKNRFFTPYT
ncbi:acyltransferase [Aeromonas hydrophila]|uniref:acyltransferase n=1 Tax=Aeromonas hydrophila TaxID=644 RepID=UPI002B49B909|nr:acyltransferase [Aeromonas hydrophila]